MRIGLTYALAIEQIGMEGSSLCTFFSSAHTSAKQQLLQGMSKRGAEKAVPAIDDEWQKGDGLCAERAGSWKRPCVHDYYI